jgi:hypothetical protein
MEIMAMPAQSQRSITHSMVLSLIAMALCLPGLSGCVSLAANMLNVFKGADVPAEFKELEDKSVAIVVASDSGIGSDTTSILMSHYLHGLLREKVKEIRLVGQNEIDKWVKGQDRQSGDFFEIGQGVKADYLVAVEVMNLSLRDGATLFRGKADVTVSVFDMTKTSRPVFRRELQEFTYPSVAGVPTTESDESKFRRTYLLHLANRIGRYFYPSEVGADVAADAKILNY